MSLPTLPDGRQDWSTAHWLPQRLRATLARHEDDLLTWRRATNVGSGAPEPSLKDRLLAEGYDLQPIEEDWPEAAGR